MPANTQHVATYVAVYIWLSHNYPWWNGMVEGISGEMKSVEWNGEKW